KSQAPLERAVQDLRAKGYDAHVVFGDSADEDTIDEVCRLVSRRNPDLPSDWADLLSEEKVFDACLIDGDHRYKAVMRDFDTYAPWCHLVALHDIDGHGVVQKRSGLPVEVPQAWAEIKERGYYRTEEIIGSERGMGIGLVLSRAGEVDPEDGDEG
ncbi:MAG TPA: hypothetical protein VK973_06735, partial [Arenicellales bacterium]|nr:hypothetical protein [Arenicellales bacterium]